ncbi:hypothetical protein, partial [Bifidobacterium longum]
VVEPASAVAGEELRDVNYQVSFSWLSCLSWLAHTICALTAFENHCNGWQHAETRRINSII